MAKYLYNGVAFPALPKWDTETYPYALIKDYTEPEYYGGGRYVSLYMFDQKYGADVNCNYEGSIDVTVYKPLLCCSYDIVNDRWGEIEDGDIAYPDNSGVLIDVEDIPWANYDLVVGRVGSLWATDYKVGDLILAASDPVPVNPPDPLSLVMGYRVGCAIRANRGK